MTARPRHRGRRRTVSVLAAAALLALAACSSSADIEAEAREGTADPQAVSVDTSPDQDRVHTTVSDEAVALLPPGAFPDGVLRVSVTQGAVPLAFYADDNTTVIGSETDLATLFADALGLELELVVVDWSNWPLAVQSGEVDAVVSNVTVTEERKQLYDFATYRVDQLGWLVGADSGLSISAAPDVAGLTVGVSSGTNQEQVLLSWDAENVAAGLEPVTIDYHQSYNDAVLALQSGRLDAYVGPNPTAAYSAATSPQDFAIAGTTNGGWPATADIAVTTVKGNGYAEAFAAAIDHAIADGSYAEVLARWGLGAEAVDASRVNPPGLGS
ncbi:transporter substrate-binding domain-containing protein [Modestobacter sp. Leaf380]|uniref:transporter substrate-binding domain-containing protein n=1 Tax=Modestobacter sp. Leaf380 TaxID=1736356 RepID=UPI0006FBEE5B|nr:transporter substrate-binding domain-containing protein [Modestobacter sp. Leaf380]KQS68470.1 ABC transporter substrate-binding protein [Modestobacter sp. Leaf380]